jgi:hypothetical protein
MCASLAVPTIFAHAFSGQRFLDEGGKNLYAMDFSECVLLV